MTKYAELFRNNGKFLSEQGFVEASESIETSDEGYTFLFVDDEPSVLKALKRIFYDENYQIFTAGTAAEALEILGRQKIHLVISDHRMPGMTGAELLRKVKDLYPATIRIMLTGHADVQSIMGAVNEGAVYKFITKPWNDEELRLTVSLDLQQYVLIQENKSLRQVAKKQRVEIKSYSSLFEMNHAYLGKILEKCRLVEDAVFQQALQDRQPGEFIIETIIRLGLTTESRVVKALQDSLHFDSVDLKEMELVSEVVNIFPQDLCKKNRMIPIHLAGRNITLAMADPSDIYLCDNLSRMTGFKIQPVIVRCSEVVAQLDQTYRKSVSEGGIDFGELPDIEPIDEIDIVIEDDEGYCNVQELLSSSEVPPIIRIVNAIISEAIRFKASDIHIEPKTKCSVIRFRMDGILHDKIRIPPELHSATISRIKILAKLDISERRRPQDGRITVKSGTRMVDLRVSTMPSINGEKVVMRILDKSASIQTLDKLGFLERDLEKINKLIKKPQGIFIATGPTGSGKTTALYSILNQMLSRTKNFETIEDPVEYFMEEANQVFIKEKTGLTFASVLRATMRQDPDVILVGEVRDLETADVAFKAALSGHMVLTTLHTNSSIASVTRLIDLGIKPYLISSALEGILSQRLVRTLCKHCRVQQTPQEELLELLRIPAGSMGEETWHAKGCSRCNDTGYLGRTGIYELFVMNDDFRHLISEGYQESKLFEMARLGGLQTLVEDGLEKVHQGITTLDELLRVVGPQIRHERICENCHHHIDAKFLYCPFCGNFKHNVCTECKTILEEEWKICPACGSTRSLSNEKLIHGELARLS